MSDSSHSERAVCRVQINSIITASISVVGREDKKYVWVDLREEWIASTNLETWSGEQDPRLGSVHQWSSWRDNQPEPTNKHHEGNTLNANNVWLKIDFGPSGSTFSWITLVSLPKEKSVLSHLKEGVKHGNSHRLSGWKQFLFNNRKQAHWMH